MDKDRDDIIAERRGAEQRLRLLTVIAERATEGIVVFSLSGAVQFANLSWAAMHGYESMDELIGKQISIFHTEKQMRADVLPFIEEVKRRGRLAGPVDHVRRNGTTFPTDTLMVIFKDEAQKALGLIGFATDSTENERTKDELRQYRYRLAELLNQPTDRLKATNEQLQHEIAQRKQAEKYNRQQIDELKAVNERLQEQIDELSARSPIGGADVGKAMALLKDEKAVLVNVFRQNVALQKPELDDTVVDAGAS